MADFYFTGAGDITVSASGDIGKTDSTWRDDSQQAYIRVMTEPGDFLLYPQLGADLSKLYGMPQSENTGNYGKALIARALARENRFAGKAIEINAIPTGPQTIRFDIYIKSGSRDNLILQIQQDLEINQAPLELEE